MISLKISKLITSLALCIVLSLCIVRPSFADGCLQRNPPGSTQGEASSPCGCSITGKDVVSVGNDCIKIVLGMGETTPWTGSRDLALKVFADDASQMLFTPDSLYAIAGYTFKRIGNAVMEDGETPKEVVFSHPNGEGVKFVFNEGESLARPDPNVHIPMDERLQMVDAQGWATTKNPIYWDFYLGDGRVRRYVATPEFNERGRFVSERDARGRVITAEEMGIDVVYDMSGIRQFLTPSRLADVKSFVEGYEVKIYVLQDAPKKDASSGLYPVPNAKPYRVLTVKREDDDYRAVVTVKTGDQEAKKYIFNYAMGDWELIRPNGVKEVKDRMIAEEIAARLSKAVISASGKLMSKAVMTYKYESWGYAMTNKVDGFDGVERNTSWTYFTSGGGKGRLKTSLEHSGLLTTYAYDEQGRKISEKRSGPDMMTEITTYDYAPVDPSDPMLPVDTRPRTIVKTLNGIECERTYYVYAPLTNIVERVGSQGAAYGGTNVLRTVVAYYPVVSNDLRSGRVKSRRHEDGKLDLYDYALNDGIWTKTVTHLHEQSPEPVSGKTTRDVTLTNARGEVTETRTEVFIENVWHTIARERKTYNVEGKCIATENLAGQVTTTAWDCCHKISEVQPDGSTTMWDYDEEGRMIASSRLIPLDMTNVTWLTTCYEYDDLGRQIATWQTNRTAKVGLPATRTRYDAFGRVVARVDQLGNTTTTSYSPDGRTVSVLNPNASTIIFTYNADGDNLFVAGTAVTPEFHTYGLLSSGTRWSKTVQGETDASPRFTKRYENMLGQVIKEERSGFKGAELATAHSYDSFGRLVSTVADYEPTIEYIYDALGNRVATMRSVGASVPACPLEWRKTEALSSFVLSDSIIWLTQTNIVSCSDPTIAPLVSSSARQLTGLTVALPSSSRSIDVRGNATVNELLVNSPFVTSRQTVPYATNKHQTTSRYGIELQTVSVSSVTNTVAYDALGRAIAYTDGRGNTRHTEYNALGQRSAAIDALGNRTTYAYDRFGNLASVADPLGNATVYEYDIRGRKIYEGGATYPVRYTYDVFGNKTTMMTYRNESLGPDSGDVTTWLYDEASGAMTNKVYADGRGPTYSYTPDGKLSRRIWARGIVTDYLYDSWGNQTNIVYSDNTPAVSIFYDALGRQAAAHDAAGITTFAYDAFGSLTNETVIGVAGTNIVERCWDEFGRTAGYALNGIRQTTIGYDQVTARIESMVVNGVTNAFRWTYLTGSDLKYSLAYPNGLTASWAYDANDQLLQVRDVAATGVISQYDYVYDAAGRRVEILRFGSAMPGMRTDLYCYNNRGELTNAVKNASFVEYAYKYDDIGNRIASSDLGTNRIYTVNNINQYSLISTLRDPACQEEMFSPLFDLDGNQILIKTSTGVWSVAYNGENRPIRWERASPSSVDANANTQEVVAMSFDRMGRRIQYQYVTNLSTICQDTFIYNNFALVARNRKLPMGEQNADRFYWEADESSEIQPLVFSPADAQLQYYFHDGNKNVSELLDSSQSLVAHYEYSPFGENLLSECGTLGDTDAVGVSNPFRFSSEYADDVLGQVFYNYRHYCPAVGRWDSRDLIEFEQPYLYIDNRALNYSDVLGLLPCEKWTAQRIGISAHGSKHGGDGAFDGRAKASSPNNWHAVETGKDLFAVLQSNTNTNGPCCSCINVLHIHSHAVGSSLSMRWDSGFYINKPKEISPTNGLKDQTKGVPEAARDINDLKNEINEKRIVFCKGCSIVLFGCWTGEPGYLAESLSKATGCSVIGPNGKASAANKNNRCIDGCKQLGPEVGGYCDKGWLKWKCGAESPCSAPRYSD